MKYSEISIEHIWSLQLQQRCFLFDLVKYWYFISEVILGILKISGRLWLRGRTGREGGGRKRLRKPEWRWNTRLIKFKVTRYKWRKNHFWNMWKDFIEILLRISNCILQLETVHRELKLAKLEAERERFFFKSLKYDYIVEILISLEV